LLGPLGAAVDGVDDFAGEVRWGNFGPRRLQAVPQQSLGLVGIDLGNHPVDLHTRIDRDRMVRTCSDRCSRASRIMGQEGAKGTPPRSASIRAVCLSDRLSAARPCRTSTSVRGRMFEWTVRPWSCGPSVISLDSPGLVGFIIEVRSPRRMRTALGPTRYARSRPDLSQRWSVLRPTLSNLVASAIVRSSLS
jgi:hypothetical protein